METTVLTNRELASLIWLGLLIGLGVSKAGFGAVGKGIARSASALSPTIAIPFVSYMAWIAGTVAIGARIGIWNVNLLKATILWVVLASIGLFFGFTDAMKEDGHFRSSIIATLGASAVVEYVLNFQSFHLAIELLLQPVVFSLTLLTAMEGFRETPKEVVRLARRVLSGIGILAFGWAVWSLGSSISDLDLTETALDFFLPVWLTVSALGFVYMLALYASYEMIYRRMMINSDVDGRLKQLVAVGLSAGPRLRLLRDLTTGTSAIRLGGVNSFAEAREEVRAILTVAGDRRTAEAAAAQRLIDNAGLIGVDSEGRQLDQREFAETQAALRWLSTCHMGRFSKRGRYQVELLDLVESRFRRDGLPEDHGVEMFVSDDGQSWYATRQAVSGWWFAIGGVGGPPDEWMFDGPHSPSGFPADPEWDRFGVGDSSLNWT